MHFISNNVSSKFYRWKKILKIGGEVDVRRYNLCSKEICDTERVKNLRGKDVKPFILTFL